MTERIYNFNAGPAVLPLPVLKQAQAELLNFRSSGMSILEISHRSKPYETVHNEAKTLLKELLGLGDDYEVLFLQGGASTQFAMAPLNLLTPGLVGNYVVTGSFADKAHQEAQLIGQTHIAASSAAANYAYIPKPSEIKLSDRAAYLHITSNNTIYGTEWADYPETGDVPLIADMSSDLLSRPFDAAKFSLIYAGAQKNLGPAGVTIVVMRKHMADNAPANIPTMLRYATHLKNNSLYNTPPTFGVYIIHLILNWIKEQGGLAALEKRNIAKAKLVYDAIDQSGGFYRGHAAPDSRSLMNVTFRLASEELEKRFVADAEAAGLGGVKGHRSVGGIRASIYNAMPAEGCRALAEFMTAFRQKQG